MGVEAETENGLPYVYGVYYFFPEKLLPSNYAKAWEDMENHCLSSWGGMNRKESIDYVSHWAKMYGIKVTKKEISKAFTYNSYTVSEIGKNESYL